MMTYSRSRTQNQQKSKRRSKTRFLLVVNGVLLSCIVVAAVLVWKSKDNDEGLTRNPDKSQAQSVSSPDGEQPLEPSATAEDEIGRAHV